MSLEKTLQQALAQNYSLAYFSQNVLKPVFGKNVTVFASSIPLPVNPSEAGKVKWIKKYGELKLTDYRQADLYEVALDNSVIVERNKVSIGAVVKKLIAGNNAVLANFYYPDQPASSWRFSFIAKDQVIESGEAKKVETNPKRYTYVLGPKETCRTAGERFHKLSLNADFDVEKLKEAFSVEKLSKTFFDEYKKHYESFVKHLGKREINASVFYGDEKAVRDFAKKLLGRIVFLYFVQKKGWLGASDEKWQDGNPNFIEDLFVSSGKKETFYPLWLRTLFYDSLNNPERPANSFKLPDGKTVKVPYLNGGLFEDDDPKGAQQFLTFPPRLFEDLFDFFNQYNFTIYEDSPDDHTVAVDPEMLGHIFENLLEDNKDKGAYYTPKEIVHYMCQESLTEYLTTKLDIPERVTYQVLGKDQTAIFGNEGKKGQLDLVSEEKTASFGITRKDVERFVRLKEATPQIIEHAKEINTFLDAVKICDPAIGSGAFPMGLLHEIFDAKQVLKGLAGMEELSSVTNAEIKENIIQNSIYGVDIEKGAVDIARLRFWLSLIVDEDLPRPLPNLDFKIVEGDSLLPKLKVGDEYEVVDIDWEAKYTSSSTEKIYAKLKRDLGELVEAQKSYFSAKDDTRKTKLKQKIRDLKIEILINQLELDKAKYSISNLVNEEMFGRGKKEKQKELEITLKIAGFTNAIKNLERLKKNTKKLMRFFDWKLDFPEVLNAAIVPGPTGFDIVIGNPPYVDIKRLPQAKVRNYFRRFETTVNRINLYSIFIEKGYALLKGSGTLAFINPNSILMNESYLKIRQLIVGGLKFIIKLPDSIFEEAIVETIILIVGKTENNSHVRGKVYRNDDLVDFNSVCFSQFDRNAWRSHADVKFNIFTDNVSEILLAKIESGSFPMQKECDFSLGITPYDKYKGHSKKLIEHREFHSTKKLSEEYVPLISGKNIQRFVITDEIEEFLKYGSWLGAPRNKKFFEGPKIIVRQIVSGNPLRIYAGYSEKPYYFTQVGFSIISKGNSRGKLKILLAILNSKLMNYYHSHKFLDLEKTVFQKILIANCKKFPIKYPPEEKLLIQHVGKILAAKELNPCTDTTREERTIDAMVYRLYDLTYEEIKVIDPKFEMSEEEYEKVKV